MTTPTWITATVADWGGDDWVITSPFPYPGVPVVGGPLRVFVDSSRPTCEAINGPHVCALVAGHVGPHWLCHVELAEHGPFEICRVLEASA